MARTAIIGTLIVFAIFNLLLGLGFYLFLKKRKENGQSLYETPVNQQTRTEKLGLGEILVYLSLIAIAGIFAFQTLNRGGVGNSILLLETQASKFGILAMRKLVLGSAGISGSLKQPVVLP